MTREKAIKILKDYSQYSYGIYHNNEEDTQAFDMAIEALDRQKGEWADIPIGNMKQCSNCGYICTPILAGRTESIYNFCPNCGADMRGEKL